MSIVYTADVFCDIDGPGCKTWTNGVTESKPPSQKAARQRANKERWVHRGGKDYCPVCAKATFPEETKTA